MNTLGPVIDASSTFDPTRKSVPRGRGDQTIAAQAIGLTKTYGEGGALVTALDDVTVEFGSGQLTAIMGPSGSGKSTLMHCMAALDAPTAGTVIIDGVDITHLKDRALTRLRRDRLGFVFQAYNLVPTLSARENISLPMDIAGRRVDPAWFDTVVDTLGIRDRLTHRPDELSGGQQQRVACARALLSRPAIVFADEPTGNLGSRAGAEILAFLRASVDDFGQTIVMVTHDPSAASYADRVIFLVDGAVVDDLLEPTFAVLGIVNTLALSVLECTREIGLLRAIGLQRRHLGAMITVEAIATAVFGAVLGTLLGLGLGIALQRGLESQGLRTLGIPWGLILLMLGASVLVGVLAAVAPSVRATRLNILGAINRA